MSYSETGVKKGREHLQEELKKTVNNTDTISGSITAGILSIGMSQEDVFLTLGKPFDIVTVVDKEQRREQWMYKEEGRYYRFFFEDDILVRWVEQ